MYTRVQVLKDATSIRFPWDWSYRGLWVAQCGGTGNRIPEFWKRGMHYWPLSYLFSLCFLYVCMSECVPQVCRCLQRLGSVSDCLELESRQLWAAWHCCWELNLDLWKAATTLTAESSSNTPTHRLFLEAGSQVAQTSLSFTVCLRTLNFWASYLYFPSAVTTGMHPHFARSALHQLSYMTHPQSLLLHSIIAFCIS